MTFLKLLIPLLAVLALSPAPSADALGEEGTAACLPLRDIKTVGTPFRAGEKLTYMLNFKVGPVNTDVASVTLSIAEDEIDGRKALSSRLLGQTSRFYNTFFKLKEDFQSWFTPDNFEPLRFTRSSREGRYTCTNFYRYDYGAPSPVIYADVESSREPLRHVRMDVDRCTFDPVTLFCLARNMDMTRVGEGVPVRLRFAISDEVCDIHFVYRGKDLKEMPGVGLVNAMKFSIEVVEGDVFTDDSDLLLWISDDANRIPLCFEAPLKIGMVRGRLVAAEGLRVAYTKSGK